MASLAGIPAGVLPCLPSSALVRLGDTMAVCGVRPVLARPTAAAPDAGMVDVSIQVSGTVDAAMSPLQPGGGRYPTEALDWSESLTQVLGRGGLVDLTRLCVVPGKAAWCLRCEVTLLQADGAELDACLLAAAAALHGCPLVLTPELESACAHESGSDVSAAGSVALTALPAVLTTARAFGASLVDPTRQERDQADAVCVQVVARTAARGAEWQVLLVQSEGAAVLEDASGAEPGAMAARWASVWRPE